MSKFDRACYWTLCVARHPLFKLVVVAWMLLTAYKAGYHKGFAEGAWLDR